MEITVTATGYLHKSRVLASTLATISNTNLSREVAVLASRLSRPRTERKGIEVGGIR